MYPVFLVAANRPSYFKQVIDSLAPQVTGRPTYISIDWCEDQRVQQEQALYASNLIPHAEIFIQKEHLGCGRHMIAARTFLFDREGYDAGFILEDDLILSKHHLVLSENLLRWAQSSYKSVGVVQLWNENRVGGDRSPWLNVVEETQNHWWGYLMTRQCWDAISPLLFEYSRSFLRGLDSYGGRPHRRIEEWARNLLDSRTLPEKDFPKNEAEFSRMVKKGTPRFSGQDSITALSLILSPYTRIATLIGRGHYIGEWGVHKTPQLYQALGLADFKNLDTEGDELIYDFKTVSY